MYLRTSFELRDSHLKFSCSSTLLRILHYTQLYLTPPLRYIKMSSTLLRSTTARSAFRNLSNVAKPVGVSSVRGKATLPDLPCKIYLDLGYWIFTDLGICADDYAALEPAISGKIMELHHSKHHQTYVNSFNDATEKMASA